jgi:hypothetical protein
MAAGAKFCTSCGTTVTAAADTPATVTATATPVQTATPPPARPAAETYREEPVSTGGYFGILFLLMIPALNLLLLIVWACGGCRKVNKRNLARAFLLWFVIGGILSALTILAGGLLFGDELNALREFATGLGGTLK